MSNLDKTMRTVLRWTHLLVGWLIGVFIYTPMRAGQPCKERGLQLPESQRKES